MLCSSTHPEDDVDTIWPGQWQQQFYIAFDSDPTSSRHCYHRVPLHCSCSWKLSLELDTQGALCMTTLGCEDRRINNSDKGGVKAKEVLRIGLIRNTNISDIPVLIFVTKNKKMDKSSTSWDNGREKSVEWTEIEAVTWHLFPQKVRAYSQGSARSVGVQCGMHLRHVGGKHKSPHCGLASDSEATANPQTQIRLVKHRTQQVLILF